MRALRFAIPVVLLVLLVGGMLVWWPRRPEARQAPGTVAAPPARLTAEEPPPSVMADPGVRVPQPQAEAAALKREGVTVAAQVAEAYPSDALAHALLGSAYYNIGQSEAAAQHLRKCLELNPALAEAYDVLARVAYDKGDLEATVRLCRQALERGAPNADVLNRLGRALMDLGQTAESVEVLQQAVRLPRSVSESHYLLGQASLQSGNYPQAKESFLRAIALLPDLTQAYFGLYTACLRLGQTEEAGRYREQFQKLEATDRRSLTDRSVQEDTLTGLPLVRQTVARTIFGAGQVCAAHQENGKAAVLFRRAASLDPNSPMYRGALEACYVQQKALAAGVAVFEQLAAEQPTNHLNYLFLGRLQGRLQQFEAAERAYRRVQELAPQWSEGYRALAELQLRGNRNLAAALAAARKAVELEPSGSHYYLMAVLCLRNNDRAGALEAAKEAVTRSPKEEEYREFLEHLEGAAKR